jgi:hypothetical protein
MAGARELRILVIGEGTAANCNEHRFAPLPYVSQIGQDGTEKTASDPFEWSDCKGGSIWMPLGEQLHASGFAERIVFMPVTVEKAKLSEWIGQGSAFRKLDAAMKVVRQRGIRFDYILVQHGASDRASTTVTYVNELRGIVNYVHATDPRAKWIFARGTGCPGERAPQLERAQSSYGEQPLSNRFVGPDLGALPRELASAGCVLSEVGQRQVASMWAKAIQTAEVNSERYRKEALLYYFQ